MPSSRPVVIGIILWLVASLVLPVSSAFANPGLPPGQPVAPPARPYVPPLSPPARPAAPAAPAAPSVTVTDPILDMKVLVIHRPGDEGTLATATAYLDIMGIPYDVIDTSARTIASADLWDGVNHGQYYAVFVTTSSVWDALSAGEQTALADYERIFGVRQVTWYAYPYAVDYGLDFVAVTSDPGCGGVTGIPFTATLTSAGQAAFGYLRPDLSLSIEGPCMYGYLAQPAVGADVTPLMVDEAGNTFLAVFRPGDGRESMVMTEGAYYPAIPPAYLHARVLPFGMINWATRGVFLGERHAYFSPQMDDVLEWGDRWDAVHHRYIWDTGYRTAPADLENLAAWKNSFKAATPNATGFKIELPFNGDGTLDDVDEGGQVIPGTLTAKAMQLQADFSWLNHTYTHRDLNTNQVPYPGYQISYEEILSNTQTAAARYRLVDGLLNLTGQGEEYLRVSGDYPPGTYRYRGTLTDTIGGSSAMTVNMTFVTSPSVTGLNLHQSIDKSAWSSVAGDLNTGFRMNLATSQPFYYLNTPSLTASTPLTDGLHAFLLDTGQLPAGFYEYWAVRGVIEGAGDWQGVMWEIINGRQPIFYLKADAGPSYRLVDGLTYLTGQGQEYLRVSGDYPQGTYRYTGTLHDTGGGTSSLNVYMSFTAFPGIASLDLLESTDKSTWSEVPGNLTDGFRMGLAHAQGFYYLTASAVAANEPIATGLHPFFLDASALPAGFYEYWAVRGVIEGAGDWQGVMWEIINGRQPIFYLKAEPGLLGFVDFDPSALLTGDYSGISPPNPDLAQAAHDLGVRYMEVNASMTGYGNPTPNTGIPHPTQPSILQVPRYANNIYYGATNPEEETDLYNWIYCSGYQQTPTPPRCYDYAYVTESVTSQALEFLLNFSVNATMFHMNNFDNYGGGRTLLADVVDALYGKYNAVLNGNVPVLSLRTHEIGQKMRDRMAYNASGVTGQLSCGGEISLHAEHAASIPVTGVDYGPSVENYAGQWISHIPMDVDTTVVIPGAPAKVATATTGLSASRSGSDVVLHWPALTKAIDGSPLSAFEYRVYARADAPYFTPSPADLIGVTASATFTQTNVAGAGLGGYTYVVTAVGDNCWKRESAPSNRLSSFVFSLVPGQ